MRNTQRRQRLRALLNGEHCVRTGSVYDAMSARMAEDLGFEVGMLGGSVASMAVTGAPDLMGLTQTEFVSLVERITRAGDLSLMVDADDGYGNAINVMRTVVELEAAGVAALTLEDTELPPPFGAGGQTRLLSLDEGVRRMQAALDARVDPQLVIVGRTSAAAVDDLDAAIERLRAYADTGVDAVFPIGIKTREALQRFSDALDVPIVLSPKTDELSDLDYLASQGVRIVVHSHAPFAAAVNAAYQTLKALREGADLDELPGLADKALMRRLTRADQFDEWMRRYVD